MGLTEPLDGKSVSESIPCPNQVHMQNKFSGNAVSAAPRINQIDAWRCIAVMMVVIGHILQFSNPWYREHLPWLIMARALVTAQFGVKIFFCISGFVICRGLIAEKNTTGSVSMKAFYVRRFLRILPPLLLYLLVLQLLTVGGYIEVHPYQLAYAGAFLCNIDLGKCGWYLAHTWSLAYEEQFYLVFPIVFITSSWLGGRLTVLALAGAMTAGSVFAVWANVEGLAFATSTFSCMLAGCVCAMYWDEISTVLARISVFHWALLVAITYLTGCLIIWTSHVGAVVNALLVPVLVCAMVLATPVKSPRIAHFFLHPTITYVGRISFTIYLWQQLATSADYIKSPWINLAALIATVVVAIFSYRYMERPLIRLGSRFSRQLTAANATT